jgi:hypothetical protein
MARPGACTRRAGSRVPDATSGSRGSSRSHRRRRRAALDHHRGWRHSLAPLDQSQHRIKPPTITGHEPAPAVSSSPAAPTLTRLPGQGFKGVLRGTGPQSACRRVLARHTPCGVANTSGAPTGRGGAVAGRGLPLRQPIRCSGLPPARSYGRASSWPMFRCVRTAPPLVRHWTDRPAGGGRTQ